MSKQAAGSRCHSSREFVIYAKCAWYIAKLNRQPGPPESLQPLSVFPDRSSVLPELNHSLLLRQKHPLEGVSVRASGPHLMFYSCEKVNPVLPSRNCVLGSQLGESDPLYYRPLPLLLQYCGSLMGGDGRCIAVALHEAPASLLAIDWSRRSNCRFGRNHPFRR